MDLIYHFVLILITFGRLTSAADLCLRELRGWEGSFMFPDTKPSETYDNPFYTKGENMEADCVFYMETYGSRDTVLTFRNIKVGKSNIEIKELVEAEGKQTWQTLQTLSGNIPRIDVHATKANVKIVVPENAGSFAMDYKLITCSPPTPMMTALACTKGFHMNSHCIFGCGEGYFPALLDDPRRHAHCTRGFLSIVTGDSTYGWDSHRRNLETACIEKSVVYRDCLGERKPRQPDKCPYSLSDLLRLFGEDGLKSEGSEVRGSEGSEVRGSGGSEGNQAPQLAPHEALQEAPRMAPVLLTQSLKLYKVPPKCKKYCNRSGGIFDTPCSLPKASKAKRTCIRCRYSPKRFCSGGGILLK
uniref:uncharacterized protein LOC120348689 isoform X3 n=1 Tax=Styela clava TaxID=7725 RepID=UPI001939F34D|nr:uncharacterized protein LOC120348689 isoform X3 [Styela clava]XP_039274830.1 uncharacterized protein LOC120348689 isoform X4 [Styela clava]